MQNFINLPPTYFGLKRPFVRSFLNVTAGDTYGFYFHILYQTYIQNLRIYEDGKIRLEFSLLQGFEPQIFRLRKVIQAVFWSVAWVGLRPRLSTFFKSIIYLLLCGDRGGTVVKVLCYKSEGRWFDPSWCHWNFSLTYNISDRTMALGSTQPLTEMSTRSISWGWRWPVRRADNLTIILCRCQEIWEP